MGPIWSWWMPWYNTWGSGFLNQTPDATCGPRNLKDPRIISLGRMPGWANVVAGVPSPRERAHSSLRVDLRGRVLQVSLPNGAAQISLYDHLGHRILTSRQGSGTQSYDLRKMARGLYVVRVEGENVGETRRVVVY
jgi:hypothetical protein